MAGCAYTVTTSADLDELLSSSCSNIDIQGASGTLNFTDLTAAGSITVHDSPLLEVLDFPQVSELSNLTIINATALTTVSLPMLSGGSLQYFVRGSSSSALFTLNVLNAPNLATFQLKDSTSFGNLSLFNTPRFGRGGFTKYMSTAATLHTDSCIDWSNLEDVGDLQFFANPGCGVFGMSSLRSSGNISLFNTDDLYWLIFESGNPPIQVNETFTLESSTINITKFFSNGPYFSRIASVGKDLIVRSVSNAYMYFDGLTDVGESITLANNKNCLFNFDKLTSVTSLMILDNENTTLPLFPQLQRAENIYMRGIIDTSAGPNIFPALTFVNGNVTVEAWNADFNCSKLVSQWKDGVIRNLSCNGTGNGTDNSTPLPSVLSTPSTSPSSQLSPGALTGIGVGAGVFVLGVLVPQMYTTVSQEPLGDAAYSGVSVKPELHGMGVIEKPDDHIIGEKPDDHIVELPIGDVELPASPLEGHSRLAWQTASSLRGTGGVEVVYREWVAKEKDAMPRLHTNNVEELAWKAPELEVLGPEN
ncbi:hypothetical protein O1611_g5809 [Lasiodiplodia mahajangana]|uniref:Uncharacterized protein n=1 Tax=Lasiodiplodia mahajangana TaxID=1108764 RepID=A0ACC2JKM2_9PEZI|nr:hypothetical protein O1611_g5809 [Lasiodiplodia mahajangana]